MAIQEKLENVADMALDSLEGYFKQEENTDEQHIKARIASSAVSAWTRYKQTERVSEAMKYSIVRDLAENKEQLMEYIKAFNPQIVQVLLKRPE